jgi:hypothetical protein
MNGFNWAGFLGVVVGMEALFVLGRLMLASLGNDLMHIDAPTEIKVNTMKHIVKPALFGAPISMATAFVMIITSGSGWIVLIIPTFIVAFCVTANIWYWFADHKS